MAMTLSYEFELSSDRSGAPHHGSSVSAIPPSRTRAAIRRQLSTLSSNGELARALVAGEPQAARIAWQRFLPLVTRMLHRALGADGELEDIVQDVFLALFRNIHRLREPDALRAFVVTVTRRTLGHELRRRRTRSHLTFDVEPQHVTTVSYAADAAAQHAFIRFERLLGRLRERERRAFILRFVARMEANEVARALGVSVPTARRAFSRAWQRLALWGGRHPFLCDYVQDSRALPSPASSTPASSTGSTQAVDL
jgi:RNA polymerase sigma-70 factor (ECF subfamily)